MSLKNKRKKIIEGSVIGFVSSLFVLFIVAAYRGQDVYEMFSDIHPYLPAVFDGFWILSGGLGVVYLILQIPAVIRNVRNDITDN